MTESKCPTPFFFDGTAGRLFAFFYPPEPSRAHNHVVIHVPPFAEEMNKARRMATLQSSEFARKGFGVLIFDLYGTGDSEGDFADAKWTIWLQDLELACDWVRNQGFTSISFWSLRMGALLTMDYVSRTEQQFDKLMLWQPVTNGETLIMQFLRLRVAAALFTGDPIESSETTSDLRKHLAAGESIEVAGYELSPDLTNPMMCLRLGKIEPTPFRSIGIFELVSEPGKPATTASRKLSESLSARDIDVKLETVEGSGFWSTQEITEVPELIERTTHYLLQ